MKRLILIFFLLHSILYAGNISSTAEFLLIQPDAKGSSMGRAVYCPIGNDVNIQYFNPAGLGTVNNYEVSFSHSFLFANLYFDHFSVCIPVRYFGNLGAGFSFMGTGDNIREVGLDGVATGNNIKFDNKAGNLAYSTPQLFEKLFLGLNIKYYSVALHKERFDGLSFDTGAYFLFSEDFSLGVSVKEIGFDNNDRLPLTFNTGLGYTSQFNKDEYLNLGIGISLLKFSYAKVNFGSELAFDVNNILLILRAGYVLPYEADFLSGLGTGIGFVFSERYKIDYCFKPSTELGMEHRFSLLISFGQLDPEQERSRFVNKKPEESIEEIFARADRLMKIKIYNDAFTEYYKIYQREPRNIKAVYNITAICSINNNIEDAKAWIKYLIDLDVSLIEKIEKDPDFSNIRNTQEYKDILIKYPKPEKIEEKQDEDKKEEIITPAEKSIKEKLTIQQYDKRLKEYNKIIKQNPTNKIAVYNTACIYSIINNVEYTKIWVEYLLRLDSSLIERIINDPDFNNFRNTEAYKEILKKYQKPVKKEEKQKGSIEEGILAPGDKYFKEKQYDKALKEYNKIIKQDPENIQAVYNTASIYSIVNNVEYTKIWVEYVLKLDSSLVKQIENDPNFSNFRKTEDYKEILNKYK